LGRQDSPVALKNCVQAEANAVRGYGQRIGGGVLCAVIDGISVVLG
jgi:hypothetical protein